MSFWVNLKWWPFFHSDGICYWWQTCRCSILAVVFLLTLRACTGTMPGPRPLPLLRDAMALVFPTFVIELMVTTNNSSVRISDVLSWGIPFKMVTCFTSGCLDLLIFYGFAHSILISWRNFGNIVVFLSHLQATASYYLCFHWSVMHKLYFPQTFFAFFRD